MFTRLFLSIFGLLWMLFDGTGGGDGGGGGEGGSSGAGSTGTGGGNAGGAPAGGSGGGTPPANTGGAPAAGDGTGGDQTVPYSRFKEVNDELQRRKDAEQRAADEAAAKAGDFEKVKGRLETENSGLKETLTEVARRNAFYDGANGKASNLRLAYIAAGEMGLLSELKVAIDLDKRHAAVENTDSVAGIVDKVLKQNPELKARSSSFGDDRGGQPPGEPVDVSKLSPVQMMEAGYRERQRSGSRG